MSDWAASVDLWISTSLEILTAAPEAHDDSGTTYYLLTPAVWKWLSDRMERAAKRFEANPAADGWESFRDACTRFTGLRNWIGRKYTAEEIAAARPKLSTPPVGQKKGYLYRFPANGAPVLRIREYSPPVAALTTPEEDAELAQLSEWFLRLPCPAGGGGQGERVDAALIRLGPHRVIADPALWWAYHRRRLADGLSRGQVRRGLLDDLRGLRRAVQPTE